MGYYTEVSADSPYGWFKLDQSSGASITNSGSDGNATYSFYQTTGLTQGATGVVDETGNYAFEFSGGAATAVNLGNTVFGADLNDNNAFTVEYVFRIDSAGGVATLGRMALDSTGWGFSISVDNSKLYVDFAFVESLFGTNTTGDTGVSYNSSDWYHAAMVYNTDSLKVYINGDEVLSTSLTSYTWTLSASGTSLNSWIMAPINAAFAPTVNATIDDIVIYDTDISAARILVHAQELGLAPIDKTINAVVTDIDIEGKNPTIEIGATVSADVTDIDVDGQNPTLNIESNITINQDVTDVDIDGQDASIISSSLVQLVTDVTNVDVSGQPATVTAEINITVNAVVSDIDIAGVDSQNLYPSLVLQDNPLHYWKYTLQGTEWLITDSGSGNKYGALQRVSGDNLTTTNLTSSSFINGINSDFGSNGIEVLNSAVGSTSASYRDRVQFGAWDGNYPTTIGDNLTYEFWFKTGSSYAVFLTLDSPDYETNFNMNYRQNAIGLLDGKLSTWETPTWSTSGLPPSWSANRTNIVTYDYIINDNSWHHLMLTKSTSGGVSVYKSYLDGVETSTILSLGNLLSNAVKTEARDYSTGVYTVDEKDTKFYIGDAYHLSYGGNAGTTYGVYLDDFAIYQTALTQQDAIDRYGAGAGSESVQITTVSTDIDLAGTGPATASVVNVTRARITIAAGNAGLSAGGNVTIGSSANNIDISSKLPTLSIDGAKSIFATFAEIQIEGQDTRNRTDFFNFKFVPASDTALSAEGAQTLSELDFLGLLFNQTKKLLFRIGNTDTIPISFVLSVQSKSTDILEAIELSYDDINYSNTLIIQNVSPNSITETIYVKFDANLINLLGSGTFLINVERL